MEELIIIFAPIFIAILLWKLYSPDTNPLNFFTSIMFGSTYSWTFVILYILFAYAFLLYGPNTIEQIKDEEQEFKANGTIYYNNGLTYFTVCIILALFLLCSGILSPVKMYNNIPYIIASFNILALVLCGYLYYSSNCKTDNPIKDFYAGTENHVSALGVDIKQLVNCRVAMMGWALFLILFLTFEKSTTGTISNRSIVAAIIQLIYIAKFFYWETGYFNTIDIMHDMCGFYILWGCLVFLPVIYTITSAYIASSDLEDISKRDSFIIVALGILFIAMNYYVDFEKESFKKNPTAEHINVISNVNGRLKNSKLLIGGTWGIARHLNYTFEILSALMWSIPGGFSSPIPYIYVVYLTILLIHRTYRDEIRCSEKYNEYWELYKKIVPDLMIPGDRMLLN